MPIVERRIPIHTCIKHGLPGSPLEVRYHVQLVRQTPGKPDVVLSDIIETDCNASPELFKQYLGDALLAKQADEVSAIARAEAAENEVAKHEAAHEATKEELAAVREELQALKGQASSVEIEPIILQEDRS